MRNKMLCRMMARILILLLTASAGYTLCVSASQAQSNVESAESAQTRKKLKITVEEEIPAVDIEDNEVPLAMFDGTGNKSSSYSTPAGFLLRWILPVVLLLFAAWVLFNRIHRYRMEGRILQQITDLRGIEDTDTIIRQQQSSGTSGGRK